MQSSCICARLLFALKFIIFIIQNWNLYALDLKMTSVYTDDDTTLFIKSSKSKLTPPDGNLSNVIYSKQ